MFQKIKKTPACYIRYVGGLGNQVCKKVVDVPYLRRHHIIVAARPSAPEEKNAVMLHLNRETLEVFLLQDPLEIDIKSEHKRLVGRCGEFITL